MSAEFKSQIITPRRAKSEFNTLLGRAIIAFAIVGFSVTTFTSMLLANQFLMAIDAPHPTKAEMAPERNEVPSTTLSNVSYERGVMAFRVVDRKTARTMLWQRFDLPSTVIHSSAPSGLDILQYPYGSKSATFWMNPDWTVLYTTGMFIANATLCEEALAKAADCSPEECGGELFGLARACLRTAKVDDSNCSDGMRMVCHHGRLESHSLCVHTYSLMNHLEGGDTLGPCP